MKRRKTNCKKITSIMVGREEGTKKNIKKKQIISTIYASLRNSK